MDQPRTSKIRQCDFRFQLVSLETRTATHGNRGAISSPRQWTLELDVHCLVVSARATVARRVSSGNRRESNGLHPLSDGTLDDSTLSRLWKVIRGTIVLRNASRRSRTTLVEWIISAGEGKGRSGMGGGDDPPPLFRYDCDEKGRGGGWTGGGNGGRGRCWHRWRNCPDEKSWLIPNRIPRRRI
jgi:hypothetical protein